MSTLAARVLGTPLRRRLDGQSDDLLTAGLGLAGLRGPLPPYADPAAPTAAELRRRAIYQSYRGLLDVSPGCGFGRLYGPAGDTRVAGVEYLAAIETPDGRGSTSVCVQIPDGFDPARPLLLAVAASGSRGVYAGLPTAGEWGLRQGAMVVYSDKGAGNAIWDVDRGRGLRIDGLWSEDRADPLQLFVPAGNDVAALARRGPHALLVKHAHSGLNIEASWGLYLLQAIEVALRLGSAECGRPLTVEGTVILGAGVSNGGATVLRALEADGGRVFDGAVVSEPNTMVGSRTASLHLKSGAQHYRAEGFGLYDYANLHYLLQPAAVLAETDESTPLARQTAEKRAPLEAWTAALQAHGLLPGGPVDRAAREARARLVGFGMLPAGLTLGHFNVAAGLWPSLLTTYGLAYARARPDEEPFGLGFAAVDADGAPRALSTEEAALCWPDGNGVPPTAGIAPVRRAEGGARRAGLGGAFDLALAFAPERLLTGGRDLPAAPGRAAFLERVTAGQTAIAMSAAIGDRPVAMLHGRADGLIPVNHASRAYYAVHQSLGGRSGLRYYELVHGQHFDGYLGLPGFAEHYVPLQPWIGECLDRVRAALAGGPPLPPSQVLRSKPRARTADGLEALGREHLGLLRDRPGADAIEFHDHTLSVPD